jgi:hypothetical protein
MAIILLRTAEVEFFDAKLYSRTKLTHLFDFSIRFLLEIQSMLSPSYFKLLICL